jgi:hypothetical protein
MDFNSLAVTTLRLWGAWQRSPSNYEEEFDCFVGEQRYKKQSQLRVEPGFVSV